MLSARFKSNTKHNLWKQLGMEYPKYKILEGVQTLLCVIVFVRASVCVVDVCSRQDLRGTFSDWVVCILINCYFRIKFCRGLWSVEYWKQKGNDNNNNHIKNKTKKSIVIYFGRVEGEFITKLFKFCYKESPTKET